jgi:hypothetical protein
MKRINILILCIVSVCVKLFAQIEIGNQLPQNSIIDSIYLLSSSASIEKTYIVKDNNVICHICLNVNKRIKSIFINDTCFNTPEKVRTGMKFRQIKNVLNRDTFHNEVGWAKYYILKSGWKVAFNFVEDISDESKVQFIFK